jgi:hypothetical protein
VIASSVVKQGIWHVIARDLSKLLAVVVVTAVVVVVVVGIVATSAESRVTWREIARRLPKLVDTHSYTYTDKPTHTHTHTHTGAAGDRRSGGDGECFKCGGTGHWCVCYTVVALFFYCCYTIVTLLLHCCYAGLTLVCAMCPTRAT